MKKEEMMRIIYFFQVPYGATFRFQRRFWQRVSHADAILEERGKEKSFIPQRFDTVELVGVYKKDIT